MDERSRSALKEWAAIEQVLAAGRSSLLLRKGGLWERREGFEMEHREFWLFPTLYHQNPHELRPEYTWALKAAEAVHPESDRIRLEHYAVATDAFRIESLATVRLLANGYALTETTVEERFHYRSRPYLHALVLRVYRIPRPHLIRNTLGYEGCVSWVVLDDPLETAGALPVLDEAGFAAARSEVLGTLAEAEGVVAI